MISHLYELQRPSNFVARPFLVPTKPCLPQRKIPHSVPSLWGAPSHNPQLPRLSVSYIFRQLVTPRTTRGGGLTPAVESSPQNAGFTAAGVGHGSFFSPMMYKTIVAFLLIGIIAWLFQAIHPPPPHICGSPGGPPITGPRIKLRDGRHLAYKEHGVLKELAKYKIILVHGFGSNRLETEFAGAETVQELGIYLVSFDRPGYGESDPDSKRTFRSISLDMEELADQLELGSKFYVIGISMGGQIVWGCLKYISHRLAGAALVAPVINYWWPGFPSNLSQKAYCEQFLRDQWTLRVAHYTPWLVHWWNTQRLFPASSVIAGRPKFSRRDLELLSKLGDRQGAKKYSTQQGEFESYHRDMIVGFGKCEFDPMDLKNPFPDGEGSVHLWQGDEDGFVPVTLQRYIAGKLPWIHYHEVPGSGHLLSLADDMKEAMLKTLLVGEKWYPA